MLSSFLMELGRCTIHPDKIILHRLHVENESIDITSKNYFEKIFMRVDCLVQLVLL